MERFICTVETTTRAPSTVFPEPEPFVPSPPVRLHVGGGHDAGVEGILGAECLRRPVLAGCLPGPDDGHILPVQSGGAENIVEHADMGAALMENDFFALQI